MLHQYSVQLAHGCALFALPLILVFSAAHHALLLSCDYRRLPHNLLHETTPPLKLVRQISDHVSTLLQMLKDTSPFFPGPHRAIQQSIRQLAENVLE